MNYKMSKETTKTITIRTSPEIIAAVGRLAKAIDRPRNWVIEIAIQSYLEGQSWQVEGVREAMASLDKGNGVPHEEVFAELEQLVSSDEE